MVVSRIQPALYLESKTDAELTQYVADRVADLIEAEDSFPGLKPTPAELTAKNADFSEAMSSRAANKTTVKNEIRQEIENMLYKCAENCAEICNNVIATYELSGLGYKSKPTPSGVLPAPASLSVEIGPGEGQLYVKFKGVDNAHSYEIWYGKASEAPGTWTNRITATSGKKALLNDLQSNVEYGVRVRAIGANNTPGSWTTVIIKKTY